MGGETETQMNGAMTASQPIEPVEPEASDLILLTIPAKPEYVALSRLAVAGLARVSGLEQETVADMKLAVTEACTYSLLNVPDDPQETLEVGFRVTPDSWVIEVASSGSPDDKHRPRGEGALGLMVMRALVDQVELEAAAEGSRSILRLVKQL